MIADREMDDNSPPNLNVSRDVPGRNLLQPYDVDHVKVLDVEHFGVLVRRNRRQQGAARADHHVHHRSQMSPEKP